VNVFICLEHLAAQLEQIKIELLACQDPGIFNCYDLNITFAN